MHGLSIGSIEGPGGPVNPARLSIRSCIGKLVKGSPKVIRVNALNSDWNLDYVTHLRM